VGKIVRDSLKNLISLIRDSSQFSLFISRKVIGQLHLIRAWR